MLVILLVVFLSVFALIVLVMIAAGGRSTPPETVRATLDSVLHSTPRPAADEIIDVRKNNALSAIPWMDRLRKIANMLFAPFGASVLTVCSGHKPRYDHRFAAALVAALSLRLFQVN